MAQNDDARTKKTEAGETGPDEPRTPVDIDGLEEPAEEIVEYVPCETDRPAAEEAEGQPAPKHRAESDRGLKGKLKQKEAELKAVRAELDELRDKYLRKLAEMENLRKRHERDRQDYIQYALGDFLKELLGVLDNFERALENRDGADGKTFQDGVEMIHRQYLDLLRKKGVRPIEIKDKTFDPELEQAVLTEESAEVTEPEVAEELQRGYCLNDRLLRPAFVKVLVPKKPEPKE